MKLKKLTLVLATLAFLLPTVANANEIDVRAGNVRIIKDSYGDIYVDTGATTINVPNERSPALDYQRRNYYRRTRSSCYRGRVYSQQSTQVSRNGGTFVQQSSIVRNCR